jgi:DNA-binding transcriptional ArsR family regulator
MTLPASTQVSTEACCPEPTQIEASLLADSTAQQLAEVFRMLGDPTRLRLIALLADHEVCVNTLAESLQISPSAVSHQLRLMRQMKLVRFRRIGRHVAYTLDDDHVRGLFRLGLLHVEHE